MLLLWSGCTHNQRRNLLCVVDIHDYRLGLGLLRTFSGCLCCYHFVFLNELGQLASPAGARAWHHRNESAT